MCDKDVQIIMLRDQVNELHREVDLLEQEVLHLYKMAERWRVALMDAQAELDGK